MTPFGLLNINKPCGETSRWVDDQVQWLAHPAKVGHAGTLDPLASGVLIVCVGQATRLMGYLQQLPKSYRGEFLLGRTSSTEDIHGDVTEIVDPARTESRGNRNRSQAIRRRDSAAAARVFGAESRRPTGVQICP